MELSAPDALSKAAFTLRSLNARHPARSLTLSANQTFRFGRRVDCEQSFPSDFRISGVHASLLLEGLPVRGVIGSLSGASHAKNGGWFHPSAKICDGLGASPARVTRPSPLSALFHHLGPHLQFWGFADFFG